MYSLFYNQTELTFWSVWYALCIFGKFILLCKHFLAKIMVEFPSQYTKNPPMEILADPNKFVCV